MTRKQLLSTLVLLLTFGGIVGLSIPLISSLKPSAKAVASLPRIDISELEPGTFLTVDLQNRMSRILVIHNYDGSFGVFELPLIEGKIRLPDIEWWRVGKHCENFGPDSLDQRLDPHGTIKCHDKSAAYAQEAEWEWTYSGENLGEYTADMPTVQFQHEGKWVVIGASES